MFRPATLAAVAVAALLAGPGVRAQDDTTSTAPLQPAAAPVTPSGATAAVTSADTAATTGAATLSPADQEFVKQAAMGGLAEVAFGQLAARKAAADDVKAFAQRMVTDHSRANDELKALAAAKAVTLPADMDAQHKQLLNRLEGLSGDAFDKAYIRSQVQDHRKAIAQFEKQSTGGQDADLKGFASKTLPVLRDHAKSARDLAKAHGVQAGPKGKKGEGARKKGNKRPAPDAGTAE